MPSGPRIRDNNIFGTTTDNPLTAGAGTFNSAGLANLEVVAAAHAIVTLDPLREFGEPEIVIITAHTAAATVATITRGAYGTVARAHPLGTLWVHAAVDEDFTEIVTSSTHPTDPYESQEIFETDTDRYLSYTGAVWVRTAWISAAGRTGVSLRRVANQSIPDAAETAISWDTEDFDSDGFIAVTASVVTVPGGLGGIYSITAGGLFAASPTVRSFLQIRHNGGTGYYFPGAAPLDRFVFGSITIPLAAGDTLDFLLFQDHTGAQNFTGRAHIYRLGA